MENEINLYKIISSNDAETPTQGDLVYKEILPFITRCLSEEKKFYIDFKNINNITTAFLNNSIGKLFFELDGKKLEEFMAFRGFSNQSQIKTLRHSIANAISLSRIHQ
ncbi:STAS-like domain-containing protein [Clostridium sp. CMCC3677]|uniref:STAS-like domain-containing protein n=1 Tax=Clostridium sp. CMCC3677 TaxID=2949963 RepID=UPI0013F124FB|nr:STAS-like domain-containing protein [Clostridium sp. CMCC3677]NFG61356.1 DUF4325 domain-containing protein [Clostridium botulinum]NFQ09173.1 DUF4325 domain-containing protein [Clostridium botulinum]